MGRGASPRDPILFASNQLPALSAATVDMCFLASRDYAETAALELVGNRYQLRERQRLAVLRCTAAPIEQQARQARCVDSLAGQTVDIDGFNLVILLEAALGGGVLLLGADGCMRDMSSIHGNYRMVSQTEHVLEQIGLWLDAQGVAAVRWWFDAPVSNSGRLVVLARELAERHGWNWQAQTATDVDRIVTRSEDIAISSDKIILQRCGRWANAGRALVETIAPDAWVIALPQPGDDLDAYAQLAMFSQEKR